MGEQGLNPFPYARGGFVASLAFDRRLAKADVLGNLAQAAMLARAGIISTSDGDAIARGLREVYREVALGTFAFDEALEDIHTNVEARLLRLVGDAAKGLHTARSRNDQVALDERLWVRETTVAILQSLQGLQGALVDLAKGHADALVPGYTHLQRAQPILLAHQLLAHVWALRRDFDRLTRVYGEASTSPLGAGALAGTGLSIDPGYVAHLLALHGTFENSLDAVQDRDFLASFLFSDTLLGLHLARLAEDLILWATAEFGFLRLSAAAGGSSIMAHKRNPDAAELVRAKAGRLVGDLVGLLTVLKGLPSGYQRDLQEDKPPVFDAADAVLGSLGAMVEFLGTVEFDREVMERAARDPRLLSVDRIEGLVGRGVAFRDAYNAIAQTLQAATAEANGGHAASTLPREDPTLDARASVARRKSPGATSPEAIAQQLQALEGVLGRQAYVLKGLSKELARAEELLGEGGIGAGAGGSVA